MGQAQAPSAIAILEDQARALDADAREEKRLERLHRRRAQEARRRLAVLEATCRELGIKLLIHRSEPEEA